MNDTLRDNAHRLAATLVDIGQTRLQLAVIELEEERVRLARQWIACTVALFLLGVAIVLACAWLVLVTPPQQQALVLGALALTALAGAALAVWRWQRSAARKPPLLHATCGELRRDSAALRTGVAR